MPQLVFAFFPPLLVVAAFSGLAVAAVISKYLPESIKAVEVQH